MKEKGRPSVAKHYVYYRRIVLIGTSIAVVSFIGLLIYQRLHPETALGPVLNPVAIAATPEHYTDFYGYIRAKTDQALTVEMTVTLPTGTRQAKNYQVGWNEQTAVSLQADNKIPELAEFDINQLKINDFVQVFGSDNLASVNAFTATRIIKIILTSS